MTGWLALRLDADLARDALVTTEITDLVGTGTTTVVIGGVPTTVKLDPGTYAVQAWLPTGRTVTQTALVASGEIAELTLGATPTMSADAASNRFQLRHESFLEDVLVERERSADDIEQRYVRLSLWRSGEQIQFEAKRVREDENDGVTLQLALDPGPFAVQVTGGDVPSHAVCIPPSRDPVVVLRSIEPNTWEFDGGLDLSVFTRDRRVETLLGYLETGQLEQARVLGADVVRAAVEMLRSKGASQEDAAVAGYYLLRVGEAGRVGEWPRSFADWYPWLPDAHIIHAWTLLMESDVPQRDVARTKLLAAVRTGILPRYSEGVRLLWQGLTTFASVDPEDVEARQAADTAQAWAAACDLSRPVTTYRCVTPAAPTAERILGSTEPSGSTLRLRVPISM